jgi:hypothetical protein
VGAVAVAPLRHDLVQQRTRGRVIALVGGALRAIEPGVEAARAFGGCGAGLCRAAARLGAAGIVQQHPAEQVRSVTLVAGREELPPLGEERRPAICPGQAQ